MFFSRRLLKVTSHPAACCDCTMMQSAALYYGMGTFTPSSKSHLRSLEAFWLVKPLSVGERVWLLSWWLHGCSLWPIKVKKERKSVHQPPLQWLCSALRPQGAVTSQILLGTDRKKRRKTLHSKVTRTSDIKKDKRWNLNFKKSEWDILKFINPGALNYLQLFGFSLAT